MQNLAHQKFINGEASKRISLEIKQLENELEKATEDWEGMNAENV